MRMSDRRGRLLRFLLVGAVNTGVDFALLFGLTAIGMPILLANILSTSTALGVSFLLNRGYTFRSDGHRGRQVILFLAVTLFALWVLQPIVILLVVHLVDLDAAVALLLGKVLATIASLSWNYVLYSRVVFPPKPDRVGEA